MSSECEQALIRSVLHYLSVSIRVCHVSIVEAGLPRQSDLTHPLRWCHFPDVPNLQQLIFAIGCQHNPIPLACDMRDTLGVPDEAPCLLDECSPVPNFDQGVIGASEDQLGVLSVCKAY